VFAVRSYRHLFSANVLSQVGDQLSKVALMVLVWHRTGSATLAAASYAVAFVPWIVGGPLLSSYADLLPRRRVLIACDLGRAVLVAVLAVPHIPTAGLIAIMFCVNMLSPPFSSARAAMLPDLLEGDRYVLANGLDQVVRQAAQVAGFLIGGVAIKLLGISGSLLADSATFVVSALLIVRGVPSLPAASTRRSQRFSLLRDTGDGVRLVFGDPVLRGYVTLFWVASAFTYAYEGIAAPYAHALHGGDLTTAVILAVGPLGLAIGAVAISRLVGPRLRMRLIVPMAVISVAALIPALALHSLLPVLGLLFVAGVGSAFSVPLNSLFVRAVPTQYRGRAFGVAQSGVQAVQGLAMLAAGALADRPQLGTIEVVSGSGLLGLVGVLVVAGLYWPRDDFHRGRRTDP
jgi:MFS family permease